MKARIFITLLLAVFSLALPAQISTEYTTTIKARHLPDNALVPTVTDLSNPLSVRFTIDLDGQTYDNANDSTAFTNLLIAAKAELDTNYVFQVWGIDTVGTTSGIYYFSDVVRTFDNFTYGDKKNQYQVAADVFRVSGIFRWKRIIP